MKGIRFYKLVIAVLIIVNIVTLSFMWFRRPPHPPRHGEQPKLSIEIGLTGDAKQKVDLLEKTHHTEKRKLIHADRELHQQIFDAVGNANPPIELQQKLDSNKSVMERMTFDFFNEVSKQCDANQKVKLKTFIDGALLKISGAPQRPGPPPAH